MGHPIVLYFTGNRFVSFINIRRQRASGQHLYKRTVPTTRQLPTSARALSNTPVLETRRSHECSVMAFTARRAVWWRRPSGSRVACRLCRCLPYRHCSEDHCCTTDVDFERGGQWRRVTATFGTKGARSFVGLVYT